MPRAFDGFSFDLFAFLRTRKVHPAETKLQESGEADAQAAANDERFRRQQDDVAFWGLVAFPVL